MPAIRRKTRLCSEFRAPRLVLLVLAAPTLLLLPLRAEDILLHSHCDGVTHLHQFDASDSDNPQTRHADEDSCCSSHEASSGADGGCDHDQRPIVITKVPFLAIYREHAAAADTAKAIHAALPAAATSTLLSDLERDCTVVIAPELRRSSRGTTKTLLLRNHALLF
jgi:hypothetical protein